MTTFRLLSELSPGMRRGLIRCDSLIVEVLDERHMGIASRTLAALLRHDLIRVVTDKRLRRVYRPSVLGAQLLRREEPVFLHRRASRSYTSRPELAARGEVLVDASGERRSVPLEAVPPVTLEGFVRDAEERRRGLPGWREEALRQRARSLAVRLRQAAVTAGPDGCAAHLDLLERQIAELERARARERRAA